MGTNSEQFIRIPGTLHGDRALEDFSRDVRKALEALRARGAPATGKQPPPPAPYCPLTPYFLRPDGADWLVNWRPGYVYQVYASDPGPVEEYEIYIGATALSNATPPDLDISLGDYIYLHFETKDDGAIKELGAPAGRNAEIVALGAAQDSTYHVLPDGNGSAGTDGNYYVLLGQVNTTAGGLATISKNGWRGNFFWHAGWNALENVGSGEKIYKDYDVTSDRKRLRSLVERASSPQINLSQVGDDEIRVEGNNKTASLRFEDCAGAELYTLSWEDGLITNADDGTIIIPPCPYNALAEAYFSEVETNDSFTFTSAQKTAISTFFDTLGTNSITSKVVGLHFVGTNENAALRNAMCPATVHASWTSAPAGGEFSTGYVSIDGETGSYNRTPGELGMTSTSGGGFVTITGAPRTAMAMMNSYNSSSQNFQIKQDTGELCVRNSFSSVAKGSNEEQNGVFVGTRNGSGAGAVTCVNVTGGGGYAKTSSTLTYSRTGGSTATNDVAIFDANCDFDISIMGQTTGLSQAEAETLASALYDCAVAVGHTAIEDT